VSRVSCCSIKRASQLLIPIKSNRCARFLRGIVAHLLRNVFVAVFIQVEGGVARAQAIAGPNQIAARNVRHSFPPALSDVIFKHFVQVHCRV
jgi:hypothetical protein